jgi:HEAT repeat protein
MDQPDQSKVNPRRRLEPPRLGDYAVPSVPEAGAYHNPERLKSAPEIGGIASILAEFDAASRSDQYSRALQKLIRSRQNVIPELLLRLEHEDMALAKKAALALGYLRSPQAISSLVEAAQNPNRQIHWHAATALACIGSGEAIGWLVKILTHPSIQVQAAAAKALGKGGLLAVSPLVDALKRGEDLVRIHAAHSLGQINSPLAVPALIQALSDRVRTVRFESAWALGQIRSPLAANGLAARLTDADISVQSQAAQALRGIGSPAIPALTEMLKNPSSHTRSVAARTLGQMGIDEAIPLLVEVMRKDDFPFVRCEAATALGEIGSQAAVFHLSVMLKDSDRSVRNSAARALRQTNTPKAMEILRGYSQNMPQYSVATEMPTVLQAAVPRYAVSSDDMTVLQ